MKELVKTSPQEPVCFVSADIVYGHHVEFCGVRYNPLHISLIRPRSHFSYDPCWNKLPVLAFLCGGAWVETYHNAWLAELSWFAKQGFAVACIEYPITSTCRFPDNLTAIKQAIRFLRAKADSFGIDQDKIFLMGESAGGYLALMAGATENVPDYVKGDYQQYSDEVSAVIAFYPPASPLTVFNPDLKHSGCSGAVVPPEYTLPIDAYCYPNVADVITEKMPPTLLIHGTADDLVPIENSEVIYDALMRNHVDTEFWMVEDANHSDYKCFQESVKKRILEYLMRKK